MWWPHLEVKANSVAINGNANGSKLVWWVLGMFAALTAVLGNQLINKLELVSQHLNSLDSGFSTVREKVSQIDSLVEITRGEQVSRTVKFGDLTNRINIADSEMKRMNDKLQLINEKIIFLELERAKGESDKKRPTVPY
mgnify:CR=1 FL=1